MSQTKEEPCQSSAETGQAAITVEIMQAAAQVKEFAERGGTSTMEGIADVFRKEQDRAKLYRADHASESASLVDAVTKGDLPAPVVAEIMETARQVGEFFETGGANNPQGVAKLLAQNPEDCPEDNA